LTVPSICRPAPSSRRGFSAMSVWRYSRIPIRRKVRNDRARDRTNRTRATAEEWGKKLFDGKARNHAQEKCGHLGFRVDHPAGCGVGPWFQIELEVAPISR